MKAVIRILEFPGYRVVASQRWFILDLAPGEAEYDSVAFPYDRVERIRGDQHLAAGVPSPHVGSEIPDGPVSVVEVEVLELTHYPAPMLSL